MPCPRTALFFDLLKMGKGRDFFFLRQKFTETMRFFARRPFFSKSVQNFAKNLCFFLREDLSFFFFEKHLRVAALVLGLEHYCPWPRQGLSSGSRFLILASDFFVSAASSLLSSTPPLIQDIHEF